MTGAVLNKRSIEIGDRHRLGLAAPDPREAPSVVRIANKDWFLIPLRRASRGSKEDIIARAKTSVKSALSSRLPPCPAELRDQCLLREQSTGGLASAIIVGLDPREAVNAPGRISRLGDMPMADAVTWFQELVFPGRGWKLAKAYDSRAGFYSSGNRWPSCI